MYTEEHRQDIKEAVAIWKGADSFDQLDFVLQNEIHNIVDEDDFNGNLKTVMCELCTHHFCSKCYFGF